MKYFLKRIYWFFYKHVLANKIYKDMKQGKKNLPKLLAEWRCWRTTIDGAEYDSKGYWIH